MTAPKAVLFDLDGTLIQTLPDISRCMNQALAAHGLPIHPMDAYRYFTGDGAANLTRRAIGPGQDALFDAVYTDYRALYAVHCNDTSHVYDGIPALLQALHAAGLRLAVLSNKDQEDVEHVIAHYLPGAPFALLRGRRPNVPIKPDPAAALDIAAEMSLTPEDFWYIGDTPTDLETCRNAGMRFIGAGWGFRTPEELRRAGAERVAAAPRDAGVIMLGNAE